jgi:hypothetical protein
MCPKRTFATKSEADRVLTWLQFMKRKGRLKSNALTVPTRSYQCPRCSAWHMTTHEYSETQYAQRGGDLEDTGTTMGLAFKRALVR